MSHKEYMLLTPVKTIHPSQRGEGKNKLLGNKALICFVYERPLKCAFNTYKNYMPCR